MPEGQYYTQQDYVDRYGEAEAIRLTDDTGAEEINPDAFTSAIADVSADMDAYLSGRYDLPFAAPIPRALKSIAAALVREKLHTQFPTETVTKEADLARKMLRDFSTGLAKLVLEDGETAEPTGTGAASIKISAPPRVFTAEKLDRY